MTEPSAAADQSAESLLAQVTDEFLERQARGEEPDIEEYAERYPALAAVLRPTLAALRLIASSPGPVESDGDVEPALGTLGDFRIVREIGRGGMGVVYEAEQMSLKRRVALKVLPFAATMDSRQLRRFQIEAQAAAQLHHTNIVPVHYVGCERGVHFYAMQYIEGHSLADVIAGLRANNECRMTNDERMPNDDSGKTTPHVPQADAATGIRHSTLGLLSSSGIRHSSFFRTAALLGIQAAEALDYAHQHGIVHRDIKPANLLIEGEPAASSTEVRLWITDFGLAQVQSDARLTMTGDLVGTLRYMSPEQALAKRVIVDHRTDVYSLGATLYELLTLQPAYGGKDREELLRQIAFEEPKSPRRVQRAIPVELETIVLKALEKNPAERYATAQEMADDLRRFLMDEPIRARRPTLAQRARKWGRRHQAAVRAGMAVLLLALVAGGAALWREQGQREAVERAVAGNLERAKLLQEQEHWDEALAVLEVAETELEGRGLGALRQRVRLQKRDVEMLKRLEAARLQAATSGQGTGFDMAGADRLYAEAFEWYGIEIASPDPEHAVEAVRTSAIRDSLILALDDWGSLVQNDRFHGTAKQQFNVAQLADDNTWRRRLRAAARRGDQAALEGLATEEAIWNEPPSSLVSLSRALHRRIAAEQYLRQAQNRLPGDFWINFHLAVLLSEKNTPATTAEAVGFYRAALAFRPQSAVVYNNLADALTQQGNLVEAEAACRNALGLQPGFAPTHLVLSKIYAKQGKLKDEEAALRKVLELKPDCAEAHSNLGALWFELGKPDEAEAACRMAIKLKPKLADAHNNLGAALQLKGELDEAMREAREAIRLNKDHIDAHNNLGKALHKKGKLDEAIREFREAIRVAPDSADPHRELGLALCEKGQLDEGIAVLEEAIRLDPNSVEPHMNLGIAFERKGLFREAVVHLRRGHETGSRKANWPDRSKSEAQLRDVEQMAELEEKLVKILQGQAKPSGSAERVALAQMCQECKKLYFTSFRFYVEVFADQPQLADDLHGQHRYNAACTAALAGCGQGEDAGKVDDAERARLRRHALEWLRADLARYAEFLDKGPDQARAAVSKTLQHWRQDTDLMGVRGAEALAKFSDAERTEWSKLWQDVARLAKQAAEGKSGQQGPEVRPELVPAPKEVP